MRSLKAILAYFTRMFSPSPVPTKKRIIFVNSDMGNWEHRNPYKVEIDE